MKPAPNAIASEHASIEIEATPESVYDLLSDITRMGEWSPEATGGRWLDGGSGQVGDWFEGTNQSGERQWERSCEVAEASRGQAFTFVVNGVAENCTWWSYEMEPNGSGTTLTERWWVVNKTPAMQAFTDEQIQGRIEFTRSMLSDTLASLKRAAEAGPDAAEDAS